MWHVTCSISKFLSMHLPFSFGTTPFFCNIEFVLLTLEIPTFSSSYLLSPNTFCSTGNVESKNYISFYFV